MKRLAILGASGHGKVVADIAETLGWSEVLFFDDVWPDINQNGHWLITGNTDMLLSLLDSFDGVFVAIGNNNIRAVKLEVLFEKGAKVISLIHPSAVISRYSSIGAGTVVMPSAVVNVDSSLGRGCIINTGATVDHDCVIGPYVHLSPGVHLSGSVSVGEQSWIGVGSCVRQQTQIGSGAVVGAGAVVVSHVENAVTVVGNPAKISNRV